MDHSGLLAMRGVSRTYGKGENVVHALRDVSLSLDGGSFTAVMGPSGSGKSTLLHCAAGLDRPTAGSVVLGDVDLARLSEKRLTRLRRERVGFVFQAYNLLAALSVEDNITMPLRLAGAQVDRAWAKHVVEQVGMSARLHHRPSELSGGQQQRVAIARALIARPDLILADEPTGALDSRTGSQVLDLLAHIAQDVRQTVLMVTHDPHAASYADRVVFLADGEIVDSLDAPTTAQITDRMNQFGEA